VNEGLKNFNCFVDRDSMLSQMNTFNNVLSRTGKIIVEKYVVQDNLKNGIGPEHIRTYAKKFGGPEKASEILDHVTSVATQDNITFNMDIAVRANTFLAHRLLSYALKHHGAESQIMLKEFIMDAYFTNGQNIGDTDVLADCAESAGISREEALAFLASDALVDEVRAEIAEASEFGVTAVPTFIINGQWSVPGAQDVEMFERIIERILERA
jgi:predicted DsbA family dithiol-disulfide isomerase